MKHSAVKPARPWIQRKSQYLKELHQRWMTPIGDVVASCFLPRTHSYDEWQWATYVGDDRKAGVASSREEAMLMADQELIDCGIRLLDKKFAVLL